MSDATEKLRAIVDAMPRAEDVGYHNTAALHRAQGVLGACGHELLAVVEAADEALSIAYRCGEDSKQANAAWKHHRQARAALEAKIKEAADDQ